MGNKDPMSLTTGKKHIDSVLYFGALVFIFCISFIYYAPCNYAYYNSDHAIHVLMSKDLQLPRDFYYWGQNRLGSLLPTVAFLISRLVRAHPLYVCTFTQLAFLFTGFLLLSAQIKNRFLKVAMCALIFLPLSEYNALILIGHPYSSQLFAGVMFVFFLGRLKKHILTSGLVSTGNMLYALFLSGLAVFFWIVGVWVSEFNAILILIIPYFVWFDKQLKTFFINGLKKVRNILFCVLSLAFLFLAYYSYKQVKEPAVVDDLYEKTFIDNVPDLKKNACFFLEKLQTSLFYKDTSFVENTFNWFLILLTVLIIIRQYQQRKKQNYRFLVLPNFLFFICIVATGLLFFSSWNLRSEFCPRYFTPVYIMFCFGLLLFLDQEFYRSEIKAVVSGSVLILSTAFCYKAVIEKKLPGPFGQYGEYQKLPKGTIIGDYWDAYKIGSIAIDSLKPLAFDYMQVRNWSWRDELLSEERFYFLNNENILKGGLKDIICQFGILFQNTGISYNCNGTKVLQYKKVKHIALKTHNNLFVTINPQSLLLSEGQPGTEDPEVFEVVYLGEGKTAFKARSGKYVCADRHERNILMAKSDRPLEWETFEIHLEDSGKISIRSNNNYVSVEPDLKGGLIANRKEARDWEMFEIQAK